MNITNLRHQPAIHVLEAIMDKKSWAHALMPFFEISLLLASISFSSISTIQGKKVASQNAVNDQKESSFKTYIVHLEKPQVGVASAELRDLHGWYNSFLPLTT